MADALASAVRFLRTLDRRRAERVERTRFGEALLTGSLPQVWYLNFLSVDQGVTATADELVADADDAQGRAGLRHRRVGVDEDRLGDRVAPGFAALGWAVQPLVVMAHAAGTARSAAADVRLVAAGALAPLWRSGMRDGGMADHESAEIVAAKSVNERASRVDYLAAHLDGEPVSYCELYSLHGVGQIEAVLTLPEHRGRGLAGAVVLHAAALSHALGNRLTFLLAEENDWPKELYRKLGFETVGRVWDFTRRPGDETASGGAR